MSLIFLWTFLTASTVDGLHRISFSLHSTFSSPPGSSLLLSPSSSVSISSLHLSSRLMFSRRSAQSTRIVSSTSRAFSESTVACCVLCGEPTEIVLIESLSISSLDHDTATGMKKFVAAFQRDAGDRGENLKEFKFFTGELVCGLGRIDPRALKIEEPFELVDPLSLVFKSPVKSGFLPFLALTETETG